MRPCSGMSQVAGSPRRTVLRRRQPSSERPLSAASLSTPWRGSKRQSAPACTPLSWRTACKAGSRASSGAVSAAMRARRSTRAGGRGRTGLGASAGEPPARARRLRKTGMVPGPRERRATAVPPPAPAVSGLGRPGLPVERPEMDADDGQASAKGGQHLLGEETRAAEVLHAPEEADEVRDAHRDVLAHALDDALRRAHERAALHLGRRHAPRGGGALEPHACAGGVAVDDDVAEPRLLDRLVVASLRRAVPVQYGELTLQLGDVSAVVPDVGVPRDEPEKDAFAAPTNQDGRMRALDGLRQAAGLAQPVVLAREGSALLAPEELLHAERLVELGETHADGRELVAVALVLALVPAAPDAVDQAAAGEHVDGRRHLRDQRRRAVGVAGDEDTDPDARRLASERGEHRPGLELRLGARPHDRVEMVVQPDRVEAERVGLAPVRGERFVRRPFLRRLDAEADGWRGSGSTGFACGQARRGTLKSGGLGADTPREPCLPTSTSSSSAPGRPARRPRCTRPSPAAASRWSSGPGGSAATASTPPPSRARRCARPSSTSPASSSARSTASRRRSART